MNPPSPQREVELLLERQQAPLPARSFGAHSGSERSTRSGDGATGGGGARCVSEPPPDPLLLDEPYSVRPRTPGSPAGGGWRDAAAGGSNAAPAGGGRLGLEEGSSSCSGWAATSAAIVPPSAATSGGGSGPTLLLSPGTAALAAYKQQWWSIDTSSMTSQRAAAPPRGLDKPAAQKAAAPGADPLPPGSGRAVLALKSRPPGGAGPADFGRGHCPGLLLRPAGQPDSAIPNLPPATGTGRPLPPARMGPRSCVPPPFPEPLLPVGPEARAEAARRDAERAAQPESLIGRLVYDSLVPPHRPAAATGVSGGPAGCGGSGRGAGFAYAPGLEPWYCPESADDTTLVFESRFECGNLRRVVQVSFFSITQFVVGLVSPSSGRGGVEEEVAVQKSNSVKTINLTSNRFSSTNTTWSCSQT
jgi:hypothetical protein